MPVLAWIICIMFSAATVAQLMCAVLLIVNYSKSRPR